MGTSAKKVGRSFGLNITSSAIKGGVRGRILPERAPWLEQNLVLIEPDLVAYISSDHKLGEPSVASFWLMPPAPRRRAKTEGSATNGCKNGPAEEVIQKDGRNSPMGTNKRGGKILAGDIASGWRNGAQRF